MELNLYSLPAIIALTAKFVILWYARHMPVRNQQTTLFVWFLFALSVQNIGEIASYYYEGPAEAVVALPAGLVFYTGGIFSIALFLHLILTITRDNRGLHPFALFLLYCPAVVLATLLWVSPYLIEGFVRFRFTFTRVPGSMYVLFETYASVYIIGALVLLIRSIKKRTNRTKTLKEQWLLLGVLPITVLPLIVIGLQHFGITVISMPLWFPMAITVFLFISAYTIHQHRVFDIQFFIPGSKLRSRKGEFHKRLRALIAEIDDLGSVRAAVERIAATLGCPVVLLGSRKPIYTDNKLAAQMGKFPLSSLRRLNHITVATEHENTDPQLHQTMGAFGVAAIVPFFPHSRRTQGWLLLGDRFSEEVYSPLDFRLVEELFGKMGELFLDNMIDLRSQLLTTTRELRALRQAHYQLEQEQDSLKADNLQLRKTNDSLSKHQVADSLLKLERDDWASLVFPITVLGREKQLSSALKTEFPIVQSFVGAKSTAFRRNDPPMVLVAQVEDDDPALLEYLVSTRDKCAFLLYGPYAGSFVSKHRDALVGTLTEFVDSLGTGNQLGTCIRALGLLRSSCADSGLWNAPLIGDSDYHRRFIRPLERAPAGELLYLKGKDSVHILAAAAFISRKRTGPEKSLQVLSGEDSIQKIACLGNPEYPTTILVAAIDAFSAPWRRELLAAISRVQASGSRIEFVLSGEAPWDSLNPEPMGHAATVTELSVPDLDQARKNLGLYSQYFTQQFNIQHGCYLKLTIEELEGLSLASLGELQNQVSDRLLRKYSQQSEPGTMGLEHGQALTPDRTLDHLVGEFESRILRETLIQCDGNKSKTARVLGLRPNTLHYKLERYGIEGKAKPRRRGRSKRPD